jgi:hypothetical protein
MQILAVLHEAFLLAETAAFAEVSMRYYSFAGGDWFTVTGHFR